MNKYIETLEEEKEWLEKNAIAVHRLTRILVKEYLNSRIKILTEEEEKLRDAKKFVAQVEAVSGRKGRQSKTSNEKT